MRRSTSRSAGLGLVDVLVAIVVGTALMGVPMATMSRVISSNSTASDHLQSTVVLAQLSEQFRRDVHAAIEVRADQATGPAQTFIFQLSPAERVEYEVSDGALRRTLFSADQVRHREVYVLPGMKVLGCEVHPENRGEVALLVGRLAPMGLDPTAVRSRFRIVAYVAHERRERPIQ